MLYCSLFSFLFPFPSFSFYPCCSSFLFCLFVSDLIYVDNLSTVNTFDEFRLLVLTIIISQNLRINVASYELQNRKPLIQRKPTQKSNPPVHTNYKRLSTIILKKYTYHQPAQLAVRFLQYIRLKILVSALRPCRKRRYATFIIKPLAATRIYHVRNAPTYLF